MSERSHLRIRRQPDIRRYKYAGVGGSGEFSLPPRDRLPHAAKLTQDLLTASNLGQATRREQGLVGRPKAFVYTFKSEPGHELKLDSLERRQNDIEVQAVHMEGDVQVATVRVPDGQLKTFFKLVKDYQTKAGQRPGRFSNQNLIESISSIGLTTVRELWQDSTPFPEPSTSLWWEVWIRSGSGGARATYTRFRDLLTTVGMTISEQFISFPERVVTLGWGTQEQLSHSLDVLAEIAELRRAKSLAAEYLPRQFQREFVADAVQRIVPPPDDAPSVLLLDTGVNRGHPLLAMALDEADVQALESDWGTADHNPQQHGTTMAGIALYGCMTDLFNTSGPYELRHRLESVKLLPPHGQNDPKLYGDLTQRAVAQAEATSPFRNRSISLTITSDAEDGALPTSWSAAIDQMCSGELDQTRRLIFIAAGNVRNELLSPDYRYHEWNCSKAGLEDPGQSWNAITVGAVTEKVFITDPTYAGWSPMASSGELCPTSRTSLAWPKECHPGWPLKPDIVMEGGNYAERAGDRTTLDDLSLLTTVVHIDGSRLTTTCDTSPATAAAARLGAIIWSHYPHLRPETVRGLMVQSARWTDAMKRRFAGDAKSTIQQCLRCYGYGIPRPSRVLWSTEQAATLIYEGDLQPYAMVNGKVETNEMHIHQLPWPREVLLGLGETSLTMRVTLSYFVEPSPGRIGWQNRHRYQSHGLRFDVIRPLEDLSQFRQRVSRAEWDEPGERPSAVAETRRWVIGEQGRTHGSLHCDWWEGTAAELADSNRLAVYPVTGWWREREHLERWSSPARYSLIVTLETPRNDINLYTAIEAETSVGTNVDVEADGDADSE